MRWEQTSVHFRDAIRTASALAVETNNGEVHPVHLLHGLLRNRNTVSQTLRRLGLDLNALRDATSASLSVGASHFDQNSTPEHRASTEPRFSEAAQKTISSAESSAQRMGHSCVEDVHLMLGLMDDLNITSQILEWTNVDVHTLRSEMASLFNQTGGDDSPDRDVELTAESLAGIITDLEDNKLDVRADAIERLHSYISRSAAVRLVANNASVSLTDPTGTPTEPFALDPSIVNALIKCIADQDPKIRIYAAIHLSKASDDASMAAVVEHGMRDTNSTVRQVCVSALGKMPYSARSVDAAIQALKDQEPAVKHSACIALGALGNARAILPLRSVLQDKLWRTRFLACKALVQLRTVDDEIVNMLEELNAQTEARRHNETVSVARSVVDPIMRSDTSHNQVSETVVVLEEALRLQHEGRG